MFLKYKTSYGLAMILLCTMHLEHATAKVKTLYRFGMGTGKMTVQGAFNVQHDVNVFSAAVDYHDDSTFMYLGGSASTRSEIDNMRILVGGGNRHIKVGSGFMRLSTTLPTVYQNWGLFTANPNFTTEASIIGIPLYFRWTPLSTEKWLINLDGFYTVASKGELQIPIAGTGHPSGNLKYAKELDSKPERFYSKEELEVIYQYAPYNWHCWKLLANTGLRRKEALQLKWKEVHEDSIDVISLTGERTKSGKWRNIPLTQKAKHALKRFEKDKVDEYVFPRRDVHSMSRAFARVLARAPIAEPKGSLHCLRHSFCSHLVIAGVPLRTVQKLAGHASFTTTEKYAHLSNDHLSDAIKMLDDV